MNHPTPRPHIPTPPFILIWNSFFDLKSCLVLRLSGLVYCPCENLLQYVRILRVLAEKLNIFSLCYGKSSIICIKRWRGSNDSPEI